MQWNVTKCKDECGEGVSGSRGGGAGGWWEGHVLEYKAVKERNEWMNEWMDGWMNEWMNGWMNELMSEWMTDWMNEWMNEWMDGWVN